jgi:hypothetical protein
MVYEGDSYQKFAGFKQGIVKNCHCLFPHFLPLNPEKGGHNQMDQQEEQNSQAGYPVQYVEVTF